MLKEPIIRLPLNSLASQDFRFVMLPIQCTVYKLDDTTVADNMKLKRVCCPIVNQALRAPVSTENSANTSLVFLTL